MLDEVGCGSLASVAGWAETQGALGSPLRLRLSGVWLDRLS